MKYKSLTCAIAMSVGVLTAPLALADLNEGLIAHYPFNGNAEDVSGNDNHGTVTGATIEEGVVHIGESQSNDSFVTFGNTIDQFGTNDFSVAFWFNTQEQASLFDLAGDRKVGSHGNFFDIRMLGNGGAVRPEVDQDSSGTNINYFDSTTIGLNDGNWHQVATVRMGNSLTLYIDGQLDKTASANGIANISNNNDFRLGRSYAGFPNAVVQYDNLRIYNRALSECEIQLLFTLVKMN